MSKSKTDDLSEELAALEISAFTDFRSARASLSRLNRELPTMAPEVAFRLHQIAAFLYNQWADYPEALTRLDMCEQIRLALPYSNSRLIELYCDRIGVLINCQKLQETFKQLDLARSLSPRLSDKFKWLEGYMDCRAGFIQLHLGDLSEALSLLLRAQLAFESLPEAQLSLKSRYLLALTLSGLGDLYERLGMGEESMESYSRIIPIIETNKLAPRRAFHYINAGRANLAQGQTVGAIAYFEQALGLAGDEDPAAFKHAALNLAPALIMDNKDEQALQLFETVKERFVAAGTPEDLLNLSKIEVWKAEICLKSGDIQRGAAAFKSAWEYAEKSENTAQQIEVCQHLANIAELEEDYQTAYIWQRRASALQTREYKQLLDRERNELKTLHNLEKSRQENRIISLRADSLQQKALRAQMNPHFLFNALNGIQGIILTGKHKEAVSYLAQFSKLMRKTLYYSEAESLSLQEEITFLKQYLDINNQLRFEGNLRYNIQVHPDIDPEEVAIPAMILQPLIENAIEHGLRPNQGGALLFRVFPDKEDPDLIVCEIEDDGIGPIEVKRRQEEYAESQEHRSKGMEITRERLNLLHERMGRTPREWITVSDRSILSNGAHNGALAVVMLPDLNVED